MFLEEPRGTVQFADREIAVRSLRTRDKGGRDAVDRAYLENNTPGAVQVVFRFCRCTFSREGRGYDFGRGHAASARGRMIVRVGATDAARLVKPRAPPTRNRSRETTASRASWSCP